MTKPKIVPTQPKGPDMKTLFARSCIRALKAAMEPGGNTPENNQKYVLAAVKYLRSTYREFQNQKYDMAEVEGRESIIDCVSLCMARMTPLQFMRLFPITKEFDGERWGVKDYFSTMEYMRTLDWDKPIGGPRELFNLMWEYRNPQIEMFMVDWQMVMESWCHLHGEPGPLDQLIDSLGIETYTMHEDEQTGQEFMLSNKTGKTIPISTKPRLTLVQ